MTQKWPTGYTTPANTWVKSPSTNPTASHGATGTYTDLNWPNVSLYNFDIYITPELDTSFGYFWAHQFWLIGGDGGYLGLQANGSLGDGSAPQKIAIFSIWNALGATGGDYRGTFGGEGTGYTVRIKYPWIAGRKYRLRIWVNNRPSNGQNWEAAVQDTVTGVEKIIGDIRVPLSWGNLSNFSIFWTENFNPPFVSCTSLECSSTILWKAQADAATVTLNAANTFNHFTNPAYCSSSQFTGVKNALARQIVGLPLPPVVLTPPAPPPPPPPPLPVIVSSSLNLPDVITTTWWNTNFPFRRRLKIDATEEAFPKDHPVVVELSAENTIKQGKIKLDLSNIVVVYAINNVWTPLPNKITLSDDNTIISIIFSLVKDVAKGTIIADSYYIYYGSVYEIPPVSAYTPAIWPVQVPYYDSDVTYTRPGEHWNGGVSEVRGGRATFRFTGSRVRLISNKNNNYGIAEVQIDETGPWIDVDMFSYSILNEQEVFKVDLDTGVHSIRVRCAGRKHPSSADIAINIIRFEYNKDVEAIDLGEEIDDLSWISFTGGAE